MHRQGHHCTLPYQTHLSNILKALTCDDMMKAQKNDYHPGKVLCNSLAAAVHLLATHLVGLLGVLTPCFAANWRALVPFRVLLFTEMPACYPANLVWQTHK